LNEKAEVWKPIPNYEGLYEASSIGRIRTAEGKTTHTAWHGNRVWKQRVLKQKWCTGRRGRLDARVDLWKDGKPKTHLVSRLVCAAFHGDRPDMTVDHIDCNPANNCADNLEWVTLAENIRRGFKNGCYVNVVPPRKRKAV